MHSNHLHPLAFFMFLLNAVRLTWVLILILAMSLKMMVVVISIGVGLVVLYSAIAYLTFQYTLLPDQFLIQRGLIWRRQQHIPYERIQTIQSRQWFFLRPFGVEEVLINTAGAEQHQSLVRLLAVKTTVAPLIKQRYLAATHAEQSATPQPTSASKPSPAQLPTQYQIRWTDMFVFGLTDVNLFGEMLILINLLDRVHGAFSRVANWYHHLATNLYLIGSATLSILILLMLVSLLKTGIKFYHFTLTKQGDQLVIEKGFFERKTINVPIYKIQSVIFKQNLLRQLFHLTTVQIDLITSLEGEDTKQVVTLMPVVKEQFAYQVIHQFIGMVPAHPITLQRGDRKSQWLFTRNAMLIVLLVGGIINYYYFTYWGISLTLVLLLLAILNGIYKGRMTAVQQISLTQIAVCTTRLFTRETQIINWHQIQSMNFRQSIWMVIRNRAHLSIAVRRGYTAHHSDYRYLPAATARSLFDWYRNFAQNENGGI